MNVARDLGWEPERLATLVNELGCRARLLPRAERLPSLPHHATGEPWGWLEAAVEPFGVEIEPVNALYGDVDGLLRGAAPAVLELKGEDGPRYLGLVRARRGALELLDRDRNVRRVPFAHVRAALCEALEARDVAEVDAVLEAAGIAGRRRERARRGLLRQKLAIERVEGTKLLRHAPGAAFGAQLETDGVTRKMLRLVALELAFSALFLASWWSIGRGALTGRIEPGWLHAWILVLVTLVPVRAIADWTQASLSIAFGTVLRRRLLLGALRMPADDVRRLGAGGYLAQNLESQALERFGFSGGFLGLIAALELLLAAVVLALGGGGLVHAALLVAWCGVAALLGTGVYRRRRAWTTARLRATNALTEKMVGHRTRLAQEPRASWHVQEDVRLAELFELSRSLDDRTATFRALVTRGWNVVGFVALAPGLVRGTASLADLAVGVGGVLFAAQAFQKLALSIEQLSTALVSWKELSPLFDAAARREHGDERPAASLPVAIDGRPPEGVLVDMDGVSFGYASRGRDVIADLSFSISAGDRVLVEGPSGGGKSTFVALLLGLRRPRSGLVLLHGFDAKTIGVDAWRRRIVGVPQFHDNHVISSSLAFNLLMGRNWPPTPAEMELATAVCRELGLGDLLERMPAGLFQVVGETGWQLSHGERTRVFLARALLQEPELLVLDETFAALDPQNLKRTIEAVLTRPAAIVAIAHP